MGPLSFARVNWQARQQLDCVSFILGDYMIQFGLQIHLFAKRARPGLKSLIAGLALFTSLGVTHSAQVWQIRLQVIDYARNA